MFLRITFYFLLARFDSHVVITYQTAVATSRLGSRYELCLQATYSLLVLADLLHAIGCI